MAVKRQRTTIEETIELDDITDASLPTTSPSTLMPQQRSLMREEGTKFPDEQVAYQDSDINPSPETDKSKEVVGRTPADLVYAFMGRAEFMATLLVFLAFLLSIGRLQKPSDLWVPLAIAIFLNATWFGIWGVRIYIARKND